MLPCWWPNDRLLPFRQDLLRKSASGETAAFNASDRTDPKRMPSKIRYAEPCACQGRKRSCTVPKRGQNQAEMVGRSRRGKPLRKTYPSHARLLWRRVSAGDITRDAKTVKPKARARRCGLAGLSMQSADLNFVLTFAVSVAAVFMGWVLLNLLREGRRRARPEFRAGRPHGSIWE